MGGLGEALGGLFRSAGERSTNALRDSEIGGQLLDTFRSQRTEFLRGTPEGIKADAMISKWEQARNQMLDTMIKPVRSLADAFKDDPAKIKSKLTDLHQSVQGTPLEQHTKFLMANKEYHDKNLIDINSSLQNKASTQARMGIFGENNKKIADLVIPLYNSPDPTMYSHADAMLKIFANIFHDTTSTDLHGQGGGSFSQTKLDVRRAMELENKVRVAAGMDPMPYDPNKLDVTSVYQHKNIIENFASRRARQFLSPLIVFPHLSTFFNLAWAPLTAIGKTMSGWSDAEVSQIVESAGIYNNLIHSMVDEDLRNSTGFIAKRTAPVYGRIAGALFHNPGFNMLRKAQLHTAGILGYHSAMYWAEEAVRGDRRAILELKEMGLDVNAIRQRGGQLTLEEKQQAIFQFVNNRVFVDKSLDRSLNATKNPWMRMLTMFHGYVNNQQIFMRREIQKMLDAGDYAGLARFAGTVGLVFPAIAPLIKSLEVLGRTASLKQAGQSAQQDYTTLAHPQSTGQLVHEYADLLSYFGSWGMFFHYMDSAKNDRLALQLMGPIAGSVTRTGQDLINYTLNPSPKTGRRNVRPLAKDILQQTVPVGGNILANRLFPSRQKKKEEEQQ